LIEIGKKGLKCNKQRQVISFQSQSSYESVDNDKDKVHYKVDRSSDQFGGSNIRVIQFGIQWATLRV